MSKVRNGPSRTILSVIMYILICSALVLSGLRRDFISDRKAFKHMDVNRYFKKLYLLFILQKKCAFMAKTLHFTLKRKS